MRSGGFFFLITLAVAAITGVLLGEQMEPEMVENGGDSANNSNDGTDDSILFHISFLLVKMEIQK